MHLPTHILSGWCLANLVPRFTPRERGFCLLAATAADIDGLSILGGQNAYWDYHHTLGHNLPFALLASLALAAFSAHRPLAFVAYLALFHLHLLMDSFGSGPGWGIPYFWPFSKHTSINPHAWAFYSWQNLSAAAVFILWTLWIARRHGRTPLEALMPNLDRQLVAFLGGHRSAPVDAPL